MNRRRLAGVQALLFASLALASLACNFLVPLPVSRSPSGAPPALTAEPALSAMPAATAGATSAAGAAPDVVGHAPDPGEALLPDGAIDVYFDQAMEPSSVEAAFSITPSLPGRFSWPDARTLRFKPGQPVQPSQRYTVTVGVSARSAGGLALLQPAAFGVQTSAPLAVVRVFPAPGSSNVPPGLPITVMFNRPVVAPGTGAASAPNLPQPLELSPNVDGQGHWINPGTYQFQPLTGTLQAGTLYTARIGRALADGSGVSLAADYTWQFSTTVPAVTQVLPPSGAFNLPVTTTLALDFSQPMDTASVAAALKIQTNSGNVVPGRLVWNEAGTQATFDPDAPWPPAAVITGRLASSATAAGGLRLPADYTWSFSTVAPFIVDGQPAADAVDVPLTTTVAVTFSQPMDRTSTELAFSLTANNDRIGGRLAWSDDNTRLLFTPENRLPYGTRLTAAVSQAARAANGTAPVADLVRAFTTVTAPVVESTWPTSGAQDVGYINGSFSVRFASPMNAQALAQDVAVEPRPEKVTVVSEGQGVIYKWDFAPGTNYTVTLKAALTDVYGTPLGKDTVISFRTAPLFQSVELYPRDGFTVHSARLPTKVFVLYCSLPALETSLYRLKPNDLTDLNPAKLTLLRRWRQTLPADGNGLVEVYLDPDRKPLSPGLYYVQVGAPSTAGGAPSTSGDPSTSERGQVVVVADSNLTLKVARDEVLVWATAYDTGQPIAGRPIQIFDQALNPAGNGVTDDKGLFRLPLPKASGAVGAYYALMDDRTLGSYALTATDWSLGALWAPTAPYRVYIYTDRLVYHPGQTVLVKGIVRQEDDARYQLPQEISSISLSLWDQGRQTALAASTLELNAFGAVAARFSLPKDAAPGNYVVRADGSGLSGQVSFQVEAQPQPEFQVMVIADKADTLISDTVHLTVQARTFTGAVLPNAVVKWEVSGAATSNGAAITDALGYVVQPVTPTAAGRLVFVAQVTSADGHQVAAETGVMVHPALVSVTAAPESYIAAAGQATAIHVVTRNWAGRPMSGQAVDVVFRHEEWKGGQPQWVEVGRTPLTTDAEGRAVAPFYPPAGGSYQIQVATQDEAGRLGTAETNLWALSGQSAGPTAPTAPLTLGVQLIADQSVYHPGDQAAIVIASPYTEEVRALITVERDRILLADVITVTGSSVVYSLPVLDAYVPNVFVNVVLVRGARSGDSKAAFTSAQLNLPVAGEQQALRLQLTADKTRALPGDTVTFALTATDSLSRPVSAEFSLALADAGALVSAEPNTPALADFFYGPHLLGVNTALGLEASYDLSAPPAYRLLCQADGSQGSGMGDAAASAPVSATVLVTTSTSLAADANFVDTVFWQAFVTTGPDGGAQVKVTLPSNLTTWRADARGVTSDTLVGQATAEVVVSRPLVIQPITPRFFVAGDQATLAAVVNNNTANAIMAQVVLSSTGVTLSGPAKRQVSVPAMGQARVEWLVTVEASPSGAAAADLTFSVQGGGYADSSRPSEQPLPIYFYRAPDVESLSGELDQAGSRTEALMVPRRYQDSAGQLEAAVSSSLAAGQSASSASYDFSVRLNDKPLTPTATLTGTTWFTAPIKSGLNALVIERGAGAGTLHYTAHLALYPEIAGLPALDRGLSVSRQYFKLSTACGGQGQAPCPPVSEAHVGESLGVKLTLIVPRETRNLVVEDYLPAGIEIVGLPHNPGAAPSTFFYSPEADAARFEPVVGVQKLTLLAADLPAGTYEYTYEISARVAGRYAVMPTLAQKSDLPEIYGRGAGSTFTVLP